MKVEKITKRFVIYTENENKERIYVKSICKGGIELTNEVEDALDFSEQVTAIMLCKQLSVGTVYGVMKIIVTRTYEDVEFVIS